MRIFIYIGSISNIPNFLALFPGRCPFQRHCSGAAGAPGASAWHAAPRCAEAEGAARRAPAAAERATAAVASAAAAAESGSLPPGDLHDIW